MKPRIAFGVSALIVLTGCSITHPAATSDPESVMVTYHVQPGKEAEFQKLLAHGWEVYGNEHMVFAQPHVVVQRTEDGGKTAFVEIFTWIQAPDHAPDSVQAVWSQEQSSCEKRDGKDGIEFSQVQLVKPQ